MLQDGKHEVQVVHALRHDMRSSGQVFFLMVRDTHRQSGSPLVWMRHDSLGVSGCERVRERARHQGNLHANVQCGNLQANV